MKDAKEAAGEMPDLARLERGVRLQAERTGYGKYRITGGERAHWVDLYSDVEPRCDCRDFQYRKERCKHILAATLREGDPETIHAVAALVDQLRKS